MVKGFSSEGGSVSVIAAVFIAVMLLVASLVIDLSILYVAKQRSQMVADVANLAAANTTVAISGGVATNSAIVAAKNIATINGFGSATVTTVAVDSPRGDSSLALRTTIDQDVGLGIGLLTSALAIAVNAASWASVGTSGDCITSLLAPTNIYNQAAVEGDACTIRAKTYLYVCGSADVKVKAARVGYSKNAEKPYICSTATMLPPLNSFTFSDSITDSYASDSRLVKIKSSLLSMASGWNFGTTPPVNPVAATGVNKTYATDTATLPQSTKYGSVTSTNSDLTFAGSGGADANCLTPTTLSGSFTFNGANRLTFNSGCYVFTGAVAVNTGGSASFAVTPGASVVFVFKSSLIAYPDSSIAFGNATQYFNGGTIYVNNGATLSFGDGPFYLWGGSIKNSTSTSTLSFGSGAFYFYGGTIYNYGNMTFGDGPYYFQGGSLTLIDQSTTTFGKGDIRFYGGTVIAGGSSVTFGSGGSAKSGSGTIYMYGGSFALPVKSMTAIGETFAFYGGSVSLYGVGTIKATAPTAASPSLGYRDILFAIWGGTFNLYQSYGQSDVMSGLIYVPLSNISIYGNQTVSLPDDGCFQIVGGTVDIYQSAKLSAAPCRGFSQSASTVVGVLLQ